MSDNVETAPAPTPDAGGPNDGNDAEKSALIDRLTDRHDRRHRRWRGNENVKAEAGQKPEADAQRARSEQAEPVQEAGDGAERGESEADGAPGQDREGKEELTAPEGDESLSRRLAVLAKAEKKRRDQEAKSKLEFEAREKALAERESKAKADAEAYKRIQEALVRDPASALQEVAKHFNVAPQLLDYEALTKRRLNGQPDPNAEIVGKTSLEVQELRKELEAEREARQRAAEEAQRQQQAVLLSEHWKECNEYITGNREQYTYIFRDTDPGKEATRLQTLIDKHYRATSEGGGRGVILTPRQAADALEASIRKRAARLGGQSGRNPDNQRQNTAPAEAGKRPGKARGGSRTISNRESSEPGTEWPGLREDMSKQEKVDYLRRKYSRNRA